jgi:hypothetical protein
MWMMLCWIESAIRVSPENTSTRGVPRKPGTDTQTTMLELGHRVYPDDCRAGNNDDS